MAMSTAPCSGQSQSHVSSTRADAEKCGKEMAKGRALPPHTLLGRRNSKVAYLGGCGREEPWSDSQTRLPKCPGLDFSADAMTALCSSSIFPLSSSSQPFSEYSRPRPMEQSHSRTTDALDLDSPRVPDCLKELHECGEHIIIY